MCIDTSHPQATVDAACAMVHLPSQEQSQLRMGSGNRPILNDLLWKGGSENDDGAPKNFRDLVR
jgi:hypothetical protein